MNWSLMNQKIVNGYQEHLKLNYSQQHQKSFNELLTKNNEEAAISEAVVFNWLCHNNLNPRVEENKSTGGMDFICSYEQQHNLVVEVTCLGLEALSKSNDVTNMVKTRVSRKVFQLSKYKMPRVLAITSLYELASLELDTVEATNYFISDWFLTYPKNDSGEVYLSTDLSNSVFFKKYDKNDAPELRWKTVSAVLLIPILGDRIHITGILHPEPSYQFNTSFFPNVPFIKLKEYPIQNERIFSEWIMDKDILPEEPNYPASHLLNLKEID